MEHILPQSDVPQTEIDRNVADQLESLGLGVVVEPKRPDKSFLVATAEFLDGLRDPKFFKVREIEERLQVVPILEKERGLSLDLGTTNCRNLECCDSLELVKAHLLGNLFRGRQLEKHRERTNAHHIDHFRARLQRQLNQVVDALFERLALEEVEQSELHFTLGGRVGHVVHLHADRGQVGVLVCFGDRDFLSEPVLVMWDEGKRSG